MIDGYGDRSLDGLAQVAHCGGVIRLGEVERVDRLLRRLDAEIDRRAADRADADPKILFALLSWGTYTFALFARRTIGWSGRRAAWLSAIAFVIVLLNLLPVGYFLTRSHNF